MVWCYAMLCCAKLRFFTFIAFESEPERVKKRAGMVKRAKEAGMER